jgi:hypothetical protein
MATSPETDTQNRFLAKIFMHLYQDGAAANHLISTISTAFFPRAFAHIARFGVSKL